MALLIDPPSGWRYGFPRVYDAKKDGTMEEFLLHMGYPERDIKFALQYMRSWHEGDKENA